MHVQKIFYHSGTSYLGPEGKIRKKIYDNINSREAIPMDMDFSRVAMGDKSTLNKLGEYLRIGTKTY